MGKTQNRGSVGDKVDLKARAGNDMTPQMFFFKLTSGQTLNAAGTELICRIFNQETDRDPISSVVFDLEELSPSAAGDPRVLMTLPAAKVDALLALPLAASQRSLAAAPVRTFYWTATFEDSLGGKRPLYYGKLRIAKGAASA